MNSCESKVRKITGGDFFDSTLLYLNKEYPKFWKADGEVSKFLSTKEYFQNVSYYSPLLTLFCIVAGIVYEYAFPSAEDVVVRFHRKWCAVQALSVAMNFPSQIEFYSWFIQSDIHEHQNRGLSTRGYKCFGLFGMPILSSNQFQWVGVAYLSSLLAAAGAPHLFCIPVLNWTILTLSVIYFSTLWAERSASYHRECVTIIVNIYMVLCPTLYLSLSSIKETSISHFLILLIKIHISSIYFASVVQKVGCSFLQSSTWFMHSPHTFMWFAMWSKPYYRLLQKWAFMHPQVVASSGAVVLLIEGFLICTVWCSQEVQVVWVILLLAFHTGVFLLQGVDYVSFWCPIFILWAVNTEPVSLTVGFVVNDMDYSVMLPAVIFCSLQVAFSVSLLENYNINIPPFTSCPMFVTTTKLKERSPRYYVMWDMRSSLCFENLEWLYPFVGTECGLGMTEDDLPKIPFPFVGFGFMTAPDSLPELQQKWITNKLLGPKEGFYMYSNINISDELVSGLKSIVKDLHENCEVYDKDSRCVTDSVPHPELLTRVYDKYTRCYDLFIEHATHATK